jgi:general secretion pathway protein M
MNRNISAATRNSLAIAAAVIVVVAGIGWFAMSKHEWATTTLAGIEPRYARLRGLQASAADLERALVERQTLLARHAYPSSQDVAQAGSDAQQRVRDLFAKAGLEVASTQVLPAKAVEGFDRIPLVMRVEGNLTALQSALMVLPSQSPSLFVEGFNLQVVGLSRPDAPQRLSMQVNLFVLRVRS